MLLTLPHDHIVRAVDLNPDGSRAVTGGHEKKLRLWDVDALLDELHRQSQAGMTSTGTNGNDGQATGGGEHSSSSNNSDSSNGAAAVATTTTTASTSSSATTPSKTALDKHVKYFVSDPSSPNRTAHDGTIKSVIWDGENNQVISMGEDKTVKFWDLDTLQCIKAIKYDAPITSMERCHDRQGSIALTYGSTVEFIDPKR